MDWISRGELSTTLHDLVKVSQGDDGIRIAPVNDSKAIGQVAAVSSRADMALIAHVHGSIPGTEYIRLAFTLQDGTGKRSAMADALARLRDLGVPTDCPAICSVYLWGA